MQDNKIYREKTLGAKSPSDKAESAMNLENIRGAGAKQEMNGEGKGLLNQRNDRKETKRIVDLSSDCSGNKILR